MASAQIGLEAPIGRDFTTARPVDGPLGWIARNSSKPGRCGAEDLGASRAPRLVGGLPRRSARGRCPAPARGVRDASRAVDLAGRVAIQDFGNAARTLATLLDEAGYRVVAVSDSSGAVHVEDGIDVASLAEHKDQTGSVDGFATSLGRREQTPLIARFHTAKTQSRPLRREKLVKIGVGIVRHGRRMAYQMAEVAVPRSPFADILRRAKCARFLQLCDESGRE